MVVIGSGNVAWHMINACTAKGVKVLQVLARNKKTAAQISRTFSVPYITDPAKLYLEADLYLLAVQDHAIRETAEGLHLTDQFLVHTSGFAHLDVLSGTTTNTGVIWPLQTLTAGKKTNYRQIPFFIEASSAENEENLRQLASLVTDKVMVADSPLRQKIHLAAVIASNLTNQLYSISASILERQNIGFDVLAPLILETAAKAALSHPLKSQTGPAARRDRHVIEKHLELLRDEPEYRDIYRMISENIIHFHHKKNE
jgi:predicted short-subunit dehydrogenase-like oxidoreductase (DUF2520 family)